MPADPILVQTVGGINILIDTGLGNGKFTDKQKRNFGIKSESRAVMFNKDGNKIERRIERTDLKGQSL